MTSFGELQEKLIEAYRSSGKETVDFSRDLMSLMREGLSRERAVVQLALQNNIGIQEVQALERSGLSREEAVREFSGKLAEIQEVYSVDSRSEGTVRLAPSSLWYLLPLLLGFFGGLIACVYVRDDDPDMAKILFTLGVILSFLYFPLLFALLIH